MVNCGGRFSGNLSNASRCDSNDFLAAPITRQSIDLIADPRPTKFPAAQRVTCSLVSRPTRRHGLLPWHGRPTRSRPGRRYERPGAEDGEDGTCHHSILLGHILTDLADANGHGIMRREIHLIRRRRFCPGWRIRPLHVLHELRHLHVCPVTSDGGSTLAATVENRGERYRFKSFLECEELYDDRSHVLGYGVLYRRIEGEE